MNGFRTEVHIMKSKMIIMDWQASCMYLSVYRSCALVTLAYIWETDRILTVSDLNPSRIVQATKICSGLHYHKHMLRNMAFGGACPIQYNDYTRLPVPAVLVDLPLRLISDPPPPPLEHSSTISQPSRNVDTKSWNFI